MALFASAWSFAFWKLFGKAELDAIFDEMATLGADQLRTYEVAIIARAVRDRKPPNPHGGKPEHVAAARREIVPALDLLAGYLQHPRPGHYGKEVVAEALGGYPERASRSLPALRAALAHEDDAGMRAALIGSIRDLERHN